jgi:hypothetical protein
LTIACESRALRATEAGGKLSKNDPGVVVKTPAGALTVRGGIFSAKVNGA